MSIQTLVLFSVHNIIKLFLGKKAFQKEASHMIYLRKNRNNCIFILDNEKCRSKIDNTFHRDNQSSGLMNFVSPFFLVVLISFIYICKSSFFVTKDTKIYFLSYLS